MQISRLFEIVYLLIERKTVTAKELADHFEVSTRTILRDVETLSMAGMPIYTTKGKGGGISILDGFVLNKTTISDEEQSQILAALQGLALTEHFAAEGLISKLGALFQKTNTSWIEVDYSRWGNSEADKEKFEILKNAVIRRQVIAFDYPNPYQKISKRTVYPLKMVFKSRAWYLQGYCTMRSDYRTFKINRILRPVPLGETFACDEFIPPPVEVKDNSTESLIDLKLLFAPQTEYRIFDEFDEDAVSMQDSGSFLVSLKLPEDYWLYGFLLSFGADLQVLEPTHVRDNLIAQLDKIKAQYQQ